MKLNYRDKVILGIVLAIGIVLAGYFALIKPKNETIKTDNRKLSSLEKTEADYKAKIAQIPTLKESINTTSDETKEITNHFVDMDDIKNPVLLDQYMQHYANEHEIKLQTLTLGDAHEVSMNYYYVPATAEIGSGLRALADINGDYLAAYESTRVEEAQLSERPTGTAIQTQYAITATGKKENLWKLLETIEKEKETIIIDSVSFSKVENEEDKDKQEEAPKATNPEDADKPQQSIKPEDEVNINLIISLYSVYDLPQVKVDDIQ